MATSKTICPGRREHAMQRMVSSTTPRLGPTWPPFSAVTAMSCRDFLRERGTARRAAPHVGRLRMPSSKRAPGVSAAEGGASFIAWKPRNVKTTGRPRRAYSESFRGERIRAMPSFCFLTARSSSRIFSGLRILSGVVAVSNLARVRPRHVARSIESTICSTGEGFFEGDLLAAWVHAGTMRHGAHFNPVALQRTVGRRAATLDRPYFCS